MRAGKCKGCGASIIWIKTTGGKSMPCDPDLEAWTAEWEEDGECNHKPYRVRDVEKWKKYKCSKCGYKAGRRANQKYCPSCGRAMTSEALVELKKRLRG